MPNYEFKDIKPDFYSRDNFNPNKVKTSENTNKKIREKAKIVTKIIENVVDLVAENDNIKKKIEEGMSSLLCNVLSVPIESDVNETKEPKVILLTKSMIENVAKSIKALGDDYDKCSSLKKSLVEKNEPEIEKVFFDENKESSDNSIDKFDNNESTNVSSGDEINNDGSDFSDMFNAEDINLNPEQNVSEISVVETEEQSDDKELPEMPFFDQQFDLSNPGLEDSELKIEEEPIVKDDTSFDFSTISNGSEMDDSSINIDFNEDVSLQDDNAEKQPFDVEAENDNVEEQPFGVKAENDNVEEQPFGVKVDVDNSNNNTYSYSNGVGSSQLYNECRRLSYIVDSYPGQEEKFAEDLNKEKSEIERLKEQIAIHEENIRIIENNKKDAYDVFDQAKNELESIAAFFGKNNTSYENDSNKHRGM